MITLPFPRTITIVSLMIIAVLYSCKSSKEIKPFQRGATFTVYLNDRAAKDVNVAFLDAKGTTNDIGSCSFPGIPNKNIGKEGQVHIQYPPFGIDTVLYLRIKNRNDIYLQTWKGDQSVLEAPLAKDTIKIASIRKTIEQAQHLLTAAEKELREYLQQHPESAVQDYLKGHKALKSQLVQLKEDALQLLDRYQHIIEKLEKGDIVNATQHHQKVIEIGAKVDDFLYRQSEFRQDQGELLSAKPDAEFNMSVFFAEGEYKIADLSPKDQQKVDAFLKKMQSVETSFQERHANAKLRCRIIAIGYTDGVPVGKKLYREIVPLCRAHNYPSNSPNDCLSFLRAKEIAQYIARKATFQQPIIEEQGKGATLAKDRQERPALRKCKLSFSIIKDTHYNPVR